LIPFEGNDYSLAPTTVATAITGDDGFYEMKHLRPGQYYLGVNLTRSPSEYQPYARVYYPGTEDPGRAGIVVVKDAPGVEKCDFTMGPRLQERRLEGTVIWPDGRPGKDCLIWLQDAAWQVAWQSQETDATGHFRISVFEGVTYRLHAINMPQKVRDFWSAEPLRIGPGTDYRKPIRMIVNQPGSSLLGAGDRERERWRKGLGLAAPPL